MSFFRRKPQAPVLPQGVTEAWSTDEKKVIVTIPFDASGRDASETADALSNSVIATVNAIQAGEFGHSIPEGVTGASVMVQVHTGTDKLGDIPTKTLDILRERVGKAMEIVVVTDPAPEITDADESPAAAFTAPDIPRTGPNGEKLGLWASLKAAAEEQARASQATQGVHPAAVIEPRADLDPAYFAWDEENNALRADVVLLAESDTDAQTEADINFLVTQTISSLTAPETLALIPEGNTDYGIWLTVALNDDAAGPLTRKKLEQGEDQFADTRVDFVVMIEPREQIEEMITGQD